jgi:hypothetical protein
MRISLESLTIEEAQEILRWMESDIAKLFLRQLAITENQTIERMLRSENKDKEATAVLALRAFPAYHDQLLAFLEERVTPQDEK